MFVLVYQPPHQKQLNRYDTMPERTMCVQRNGTTMLLDYCTSTTTTTVAAGGGAAGGGAANSATTTRGKEGTRFTLVRYNSGFQQQPQHYHHYQHQHDTMEDQTLPGIPKETASTATTTTSVTAAAATTTHIANTKDLAHSHASVPSKKPTSALLKPSNKKKPNPNNKSNNNRNPKRQTGQQSRNHLIHTLAPLTLESHHHHHHHYADDDGLTQQTIMATKTTTTTTTFVKKTHDNNNNNVAALNLRMLQPHPYIAAAKNGIYTDPQTGLQYPTDLCNYLGDSEKDAGRHTLMGVGQYTKTVFHIKVCFGRPCH
jgi:hypothetical protein